jgi:hypothetical protein
MTRPEHVTNRNLIKRRVKLSRRQFIGLLATVGVGAGGLCGGVVGISVRHSQPNTPTPTATDTPTQIPPTPIASVPKPNMVTRTVWGARSPNLNAINERGFYDATLNPAGWYVYPDALQDSYQTLVIHHSAFYEQDGPSTMLEIQRLHRDDRGWADVGYHFMVDRDGTIYEGRDLTVRGVHVQGYNTGSIGVCLLGDFRVAMPTDAQLDAMYALNDWIVYRTGVTYLAGHGDFNDFTECPGATLSAQLPQIATRAGLVYGTDGYRGIGEDSLGRCSCGGVHV